MSENDDAIEAVIHACVNEEHPETIITGWTLVVSTTVTGDLDATAYVYRASIGQPIHSTLGLLEMARRFFRGTIGNAEEDGDL